MKHFCHNGRGLFDDDSTLIHMAQGVTEWFDETEKNVNHVLLTQLSSYHVMVHVGSMPY